MVHWKSLRMIERQLSNAQFRLHLLTMSGLTIWMPWRRKFTTSIQPAKAYEDESVMLSGPH